MIKKPSRYLLNKGVVAIGPMKVGEQHVIPWRAMNWHECANDNVKVLYLKHFPRAKSTRPLWVPH